MLRRRWRQRSREAVNAMGCANFAYGMPFGWGMGIGPILLLAAAAILWRCLASNRRHSPQAGMQALPPKDILARRFASGEITADEFERMKRSIDGIQSS